MSEIRFRTAGQLPRDEHLPSRESDSYARQRMPPRDYDDDDDDAADRENRYRERERDTYGSSGRDSPPRGGADAESTIRRDYLEKFGSVARERQRVEEYRRWEMSQLLYGKTGKPSRVRKPPQVMHSQQFELVMKEISNLYDIDFERIRELVPESKRVASVPAKGCFICRLCRHTWASEMAWVDIDLWDRCICCYYQQKCMHCCEEKDSAAIPMFAETQQRRLICRGFLRSGLIRTATLSLKVFLAGPQRPKSTTSKPHLGLLCGKCGYDNCDLPPCSAANEGKADKADKKLAALYDDMRDKASAPLEPNESGERITIATGGGGGGCGCPSANKLRRPNCDSAGLKRPRFRSLAGTKTRLSVHDRLGPLKPGYAPYNGFDNDTADGDEGTGSTMDMDTGSGSGKDGPAPKRPRVPITTDGLSSSPDKDMYVSKVPAVATAGDAAAAASGAAAAPGRRKKSLLLSHLERAAAKSRGSGGLVATAEDEEDTAMDTSTSTAHVRPVAYVKQEQPWLQQGYSGGSEKLSSRTEQEWQHHCLVEVEDADGDEVEYMYTVNPDGDLFGNSSSYSNSNTAAAPATNGATASGEATATADPAQERQAEKEQVVLGPDGQPMTIKRERNDLSYYHHNAGAKPFVIKEELPWMQDGTTPWADPRLSAQGDGEEGDGGMYLMEDADDDGVEYLFTKFPTPARLTIDDEEAAASAVVSSVASATNGAPSATGDTAAVAERSHAPAPANIVAATPAATTLANGHGPTARPASPASPSMSAIAASPADEESRDSAAASPVSVKKEPAWDDDIDIDADDLLDYDFDESASDLAHDGNGSATADRPGNAT